MSDWHPSTTPNFSPSEMGCKCGKCDGSAKMDQAFMVKLQAIRDIVGPMTVTSGYRCPQHPVEARKATPGMHGRGRAVDIAMIGGKRMLLIRAAMINGMRGFGFGASFQHLDDRDDFASWTY